MVWSDASSCSGKETRRIKELESKLREERGRRKDLEREVIEIRKELEEFKREVREDMRMMRGKMEKMEKTEGNRKESKRGRSRSRGMKRRMESREKFEKERIGKRWQEERKEKMEQKINDKEEDERKRENLENEKIRKGLAAVIRRGRRGYGIHVEEWLEGKIGTGAWWCKYSKEDRNTVKVFLDNKERKKKLMGWKQEMKEEKTAYIDDWLTKEERRERTLLWLEAEKAAKVMEKMGGQAMDMVKEDRR